MGNSNNCYIIYRSTTLTYSKLMHLKNIKYSISASLWDCAGTQQNCLIFPNALIKNICTLAKKSFPLIFFFLFVLRIFEMKINWTSGILKSIPSFREKVNSKYFNSVLKQHKKYQQTAEELPTKSHLIHLC